MAVVLLLLALLRLWPLLSATPLEVVDQQTPDLTCSEGLTDCHISQVSHYAPALPDTDDALNVTQVQLKALLCCSAGQNCEPCLQVIITIQGTDSANQVPLESDAHNDEEELSLTEASGQPTHHEPRALVKVCFSAPGTLEFCKTLKFEARYTATNQSAPQLTHELRLTERVKYGIPVVVTVDPTPEKNITISSLEEVCSMSKQGTVKDCDAPRLQAVTDHQRNVVLLQLENNDTRQDDIMGQMLWNEMPGEVLAWPKGERELVISSNMVAPCLCFLVWREGKGVRNKFCPFKNQQDALERMQNNISVSVAMCQMRDGGVGLTWNVSAPCRLEAEVWLCKKELAGGHCEEVEGTRQKLHNQVHDGWRATRKGHWKAGEFNMTPHPKLCVQIKIKGMKSFSEPQCPFETPRQRWSLLLLIGSLLMCLVIIGAYFTQGVLKGYVWRWLKGDDVKDAVGSGHVILLYPPDDDDALRRLMCRLGSSLQTLGFSVSLDLWSQGELGALGPVPWLHSRLDQLKRQGGKVVLVLTQTAWIRAEEWGAQSWERSRDVKEEDMGRSYAASPCTDVFTASLSCVLADYLQGRAGERFMLVQFESMPPEPPGGFRPLPELFRGLHVYSLPSQSLGFLTELAIASQTDVTTTRRKRACGIRIASRFLDRGLSGFTAGTTVLRFVGARTQNFVGGNVEDSEEMIPLQPCILTPPSSPDVNPMNWV